MNHIIKMFWSMKWFFISIVVVLLIAIVLSQLSMHSMGENALSDFINLHNIFWLLVRACIILGFVMIWPYLIKHWANKYQWEDEYITGLIARRWRYALWLVIIDVTFQLL